MKILAIETSCDETAISIVEASGEKNPKFKILGNSLLSQIDIHKKYGGVFPMMAKREHSKNLVPLLEDCLKQAEMFQLKNDAKKIPENLEKIFEREPELMKNFAELVPRIERPDINAVAVTTGPGLEPALWVGINFAKALAILWDLPIIPTNHMEGHIVSSLISESSKPVSVQNNKKLVEFPAIALLISGGHTELVLVKDWLKYEIIGRTKDDAVGEAFDKVARMLGLPYPGGPEISRLAAAHRTSGKISNQKFPRPMIHSHDFDFSFSGLKTAVLYAVKKIGELGQNVKEEIAREFEDAAVEVLVSKTKNAVEKFGAKTLILGGGVTANKEIRRAFEEVAAGYEISLFIPDPKLSTDNALMIAAAAYSRIIGDKKILEKKSPERNLEIKAEGNLSL